LRAFEKATIESIYEDNREYVKRSFEFSVGKYEIDDKLANYKEATENLTTIL
jgi:hypothetical protein